MKCTQVLAPCVAACIVYSTMLTLPRNRLFRQKCHFTITTQENCNFNLCKNPTSNLLYFCCSFALIAEVKLRKSNLVQNSSSNFYLYLFTLQETRAVPVSTKPPAAPHVQETRAVPVSSKPAAFQEKRTVPVSSEPSSAFHLRVCLWLHRNNRVPKQSLFKCRSSYGLNVKQNASAGRSTLVFAFLMPVVSQCGSVTTSFDLVARRADKSLADEWANGGRSVFLYGQRCQGM